MVILSERPDETPHSRYAHLFFGAMLHFNPDARLFKAQTVWRRKNVLPSVSARPRYDRFVTHSAENTGHKILHVIPFQFLNAVLDEFMATGQHNSPAQESRCLETASVSPHLHRTLTISRNRWLSRFPVSSSI